MKLGVQELCDRYNIKSRKTTSVLLGDNTESAIARGQIRDHALTNL